VIPLKTAPRTRGNCIIEFALLLPWVIFLFVGVLDYGFYAYALIATQNAARVAALYTSTSSTTAADQTTACSYVRAEMYMAPNIGSGVTSCGANPLIVTATSVAAASSADGSAAASSVSVTYQTITLIPIPGILMGSYTFTRTVQMRLRG
jgi:Flp pilus assembly protein TadG